MNRRAFLRGGAALAALAAVPGAAFASGGVLTWWGADYGGPDQSGFRLVMDGRVLLPAGTYTFDAVALCEVQHLARRADNAANLERYTKTTICRIDA